MLQIVDPGRRATVLDATAAALLLRGSDTWFGPGERRRHRDQVAAADGDYAEAREKGVDVRLLLFSTF